jgi:hypothetical protein
MTERKNGGDPMSSLRRWVQAPYRVTGQLEVVGRTSDDRDLIVTTRMGNCSGIRLTSPRQLADGAQVRLTIQAPDGAPLRASAMVAKVTKLPGGGCEADIVFDDEQPRLSAARIDLAA